MTSHTMRDSSDDGTTHVCQLCLSQSFEHVITTVDWLMPGSGEFSVYRCMNCGLAETRPRLTPDELASHYPRQQYGGYAAPGPKIGPSAMWIRRMRRLKAHVVYRHQWHRTWRTWLQSAPLSLWPVSAILRTGLPFRDLPGKILDIGCARGHFLRAARADGWTCYGVELTSGLADSLITDGIADIRYGRFEEIAFEPSTSFDVIRMSHVLEHFENPILVLRRCFQLLADDGLLIIGVPIVSPLEMMLFGKYPWWAWELPRHQSHFEKRALYRALSQAGFTISSFVYEASANDWVHSFNNWQKSRHRQFQLPVHSRSVQMALKPLGLMLKLTHQSGRVLIYARKK